MDSLTEARWQRQCAVELERQVAVDHVEFQDMLLRWKNPTAAAFLNFVRRREEGVDDMARAKGKELIYREASQLFCHKCKRWVESNEKVEMLASDGNGHKRTPSVWTCPPCRGEETRPQAVAPEALQAKDEERHRRLEKAGAGAEISKDEHEGPWRKIVEVMEQKGDRATVKLECGHVYKTGAYRIKQGRKRCRRCKKKEE